MYYGKCMQRVLTMFCLRSGGAALIMVMTVPVLYLDCCVILSSTCVCLYLVGLSAFFLEEPVLTGSQHCHCYMYYVLSSMPYQCCDSTQTHYNGLARIRITPQIYNFFLKSQIILYEKANFNTLNG